MTKTLVSRDWGRLSFRVAALAAVVALGGGCAVQGEDGEAEGASAVALGERVAPGVFKLYGDPGYEASTWCDVHTVLELTNDARGAIARLHETVRGYCEIHVVPNERTYRLELAGDDCGSQIFKGKTTQNGLALDVEVIDHRSRICRDDVPAQIIVEESSPDDHAYGSVKYSDDDPEFASPDVDVDPNALPENL